MLFGLLTQAVQCAGGFLHPKEDVATHFDKAFLQFRNLLQESSKSCEALTEEQEHSQPVERYEKFIPCSRLEPSRNTFLMEMLRERGESRPREAILWCSDVVAALGKAVYYTPDSETAEGEVVESVKINTNLIEFTTGAKGYLPLTTATEIAEDMGEYIEFCREQHRPVREEELDELYRRRVGFMWEVPTTNAVNLNDVGRSNFVWLDHPSDGKRIRLGFWPYLSGPVGNPPSPVDTIVPHLLSPDDTTIPERISSPSTIDQEWLPTKAFKLWRQLWSDGH